MPKCERLPYLRGTMMVGDSMTKYGKDYLRSKGKTGWFIDALGGRPVTDLPVRINAYLNRVNGQPPRVAILALGTNERPGWTKEDYEAAVAKFPTRTRIVFVTTYRPTHTSTGALYTRWMKEIAAERPRTAIADWRAIASTDRHRYLRDRLHQSRPVGIRAWGNRVIAAVERAENLGAKRDAAVRDARADGRCV